MTTIRVLPHASRRPLRAVVAVLSLLIGFAVPLALAAPASAITTTGWNLVGAPSPVPSAPSPRAWATMAYGPGDQPVVLFGGSTQVGPLGDTWTWNGAVWTQQHPATSPAAQYGASMTYDYYTHQLIFFGTSADGLTPETWTWDGTTWTQLTPAASPSARLDAAMVYDRVSGRLVLFGGRRPSLAAADTAHLELGDTWAWDGTTWTQLAPTGAPSARWGAAAAYDPVVTGGTSIVLFGGTDSGRDVFGDTWGWTGSTWVQAHPPTQPDPRFGGSMIYDEDSRRIVMIGGYNYGNYLHNTWTWAGGGDWIEPALPDPVPSQRAFASIAYDFATSQLVLFGGQTATGFGFVNDTWVYGDPRLRQWIAFTSTPPNPALVGDSYHVTVAAGASGMPVVVSVDADSDPGACTATDAGLVTFTGVGRCLIDANEAGTDGYFAAGQIQQSVTVVPPAPVDRTPPALGGMPGDVTATATGPAGAVVGYVAPTATDGVDGPVPVTCTPASGSTFAFGTTSVTCTASDAAGNTATGSFRVTVGYRWDGFLQPVNDTAHSVGTALSVFKAGSSVPIKFQLKLADGTALPGSTSPVFLAPVRGAATTAAVDESLYSDPGTSGTAFSYDPGSKQYQYNFKTTKDMAGYWWRVAVLLPDGTKQYVTLGLR